ncbi:MAG: hypothetical protein ABFC94_19035 [Syntrophomonas sp.]
MVKVEVETVKMSTSIDILGVHEPEKLAEGLCPGCKTMVDLWLTKQGLELSLPGKGYITEPSNRYEQNWDNPNKESHLPPKPIIIEEPYKSNSNEQSLSLEAISNFLLMNIPCSINIKKTVFFVILSLVSIALLIQTVYLPWPAIMEPYVIPLDTDWTGTIKTMEFIIFALIIINFVAYKVDFSDSGPNQIDKWILASSIVILAYCLLSSIVMPLLFLKT